MRIGEMHRLEDGPGAIGAQQTEGEAGVRQLVGPGRRARVR
jgi:hypothetical protein